MNPASVNSSHSSQPALHRRRVHTITDRFSMSNTYLIEEERLLVIDPGSELNVRLLLNYLQRFLRQPATDIDTIVLTHLQHDHTTGVATLKRVCGAAVAASSGGRGGRVEGDPYDGPYRGPYGGRGGGAYGFGHLEFFPSQRASQFDLVDTWLEDVAGLPLHQEWRVIASPGYTLESLCLYNPFTYELICGDTITTQEGGVPIVRGGLDRRRLEETLRVLRTLEIHYLYPGHGRPILGEHPLQRVEAEW